MTKSGVRIIDGDGHVIEDLHAIAKLMPYPYSKIPMETRTTGLVSGLMPPLDHLHLGWIGTSPPDAFTPVGVDGWIDFTKALGLQAAVLYPTKGLAYYKITNSDWAIAVARSYNNWLHEAYMQRDPLFKGMGLIPLQEPEAAVEELNRIVTELGMPGAMLAPNSLPMHLGSKAYWPVYQEAERLGCAIGIHGGCHSRIGMDDMNVFSGIHAIGHPHGQLISFAGMVFNGVFDRFPRLRVGFLEGGVAWLMLALERFSGSYSGFTPHDLRGELLQLDAGDKVSDYIVKRIRAGQIFVGCEGDEAILPYAVKVVGNQPFVFSSDFPHEVNTDTCREEIEELIENEELKPADKQAVLAGNAERFYNLQPASGARGGVKSRTAATAK